MEHESVANADDSCDEIREKSLSGNAAHCVESPSEQGEIASYGSGSTASTKQTVHLSSARKICYNQTIRHRVPGGAAAKRFGPLQEVGEIAESDSVEDDLNEIDTTEILNVMNETKQYFTKGSKHNRRYVENAEIGESSDDDEKDKDCSKKERGAKILSRSEAFPENADASVAALLAGSSSYTGGLAGATNVEVQAQFESVYQSPKSYDVSIPVSTGEESDKCIVEGEIFESFSKQGAATAPIISSKTVKRLDFMSARMKDPNKTLSNLLKAIASLEEKTEMDRGYMVRRKNACGALQVLTACSRKRKIICWTVGVLAALTSVLQDGGDEGLEAAFPDPRTRIEYEDARKRAVASLMNLSMPVRNRLAVFHTPGLIQAIIDILYTDEGESLQGCCAILAYLAKSEENRLLMGQVPGIFDAVLFVLTPEPIDIDSASKKMAYPWSSASESDISTASANSSDYSKNSDDISSVDDESLASHSCSSGSNSNSYSDPSTLSTSSESSISESSVGKDKREKPCIAFSKKSKFVLPKGKNEEETLKERAIVYDENRYMRGARKNLFAMLGHLVKEKDNAFRIARIPDLVATVSNISRFRDSVAHNLAVQLLAHLTRHRLNTKMIVFKLKIVIPALIEASNSDNDVARKYACYAIQNLSHDKSCRHELANNETLVKAICKRAHLSKDSEERLSSICSLKNLAYDPANLIPMSNTPECIATLMHIAHGKEDGITESMQFHACDALASLSHWLRKIATNGEALDALNRGTPASNELFVPSLRVVTLSQWQ